MICHPERSEGPHKQPWMYLVRFFASLGMTGYLNAISNESAFVPLSEN